MIPVVATLGVMDGVHLGHQAVVASARARAREAGARLVAFTFDPPPWVVLKNRPGEPLLTLLGERLALLRDAGVDEVRVLHFDHALAAKSPEAFLVEHVFPFARLASLVLGYDFALGRDREGTPAALARLGKRRGFSVATVPALVRNGTPISSRRIRDALARGDVDEALACLGRPYAQSGVVESGEGRGRTLGFPTANIRIPPGRLSPAHGVYAVRVHGIGAEGLPGVANLGRRPTFGGGEERLEVHILKPVGTLNGVRLTVDFIARIRPEVKFNDINELSTQIARDAARAEALLGAAYPLS
ncbi:MAG TPA: riboflavin biosynthesis protein RibF [Candidatus Eisenbacteria bacterium]|nr:riboflavin biosynthesis protein RibF [Candidatus Eisenbacteria bacterium]